MTPITGKAPRQNKCPRCDEKGHQWKTCPNEAKPGWVQPQAKSTSAQGLPKSGNAGKKRKTPPPELAVDSDGNAGVDGDESDAEEQDVRLDPRERADRDAENNPNPAPTPTNAEDKWKEVPINPILTTATRTGIIVGSGVPPTNQTYAGSVNIPDGTTDPGHFFDLLLDDATCQRFADQTNLYVQAQERRAWTASNPLSADEVKRFFGLHFYMGIKQVPDRTMYWSKGIYGDPYVRKTMSRDRFMAIQAHLHWTDTSGLSQAERKAKNKEDSFWTVRSFLEILARNFSRYFECGRYLDIDEMTIPFKGRHSARVYNPNKPNKWGLKAFCLNDALTGYLTNFFMYLGKDEQRPAGMAATLWPVIKLTEPALYHEKEHILCTDNWYTQVEGAVAVSAAPRSMHYVGTIKVNKTGLPKKGLFAKTGAAKHARGDMQCYESSVPNSETKLYFTAWQDSKPVHILSTFPPFRGSCQRNSKTVNGTWSGKEDIPRPSVIPEYNSGMGGTDLNDQLNSYYNDRHRVHKWTQRMFNHFLHVIMNNAKVLFNDHVGKDGEMVLLKFQQSVVEHLCSAGRVEASEVDEAEEEVEEKRPVRPVGNRKQRWVADFRLRNTGKHVPGFVGNDKRQNCIICKRKMELRCETCDVWVCYGSAQCWSTFHDIEDPWGA